MNVYVVKEPYMYGGNIMGVYNLPLEDVQKLYEDSGYAFEIETHPL